jgi:hypothetical protein
LWFRLAAAKKKEKTENNPISYLKIIKEKKKGLVACLK